MTHKQSIESLFAFPAKTGEVPAKEERSPYWSDSLFNRDRDRGYRYGYNILGWGVESPDLRDTGSEASKALEEVMFSQNAMYGVKLECSEDDSNELRLGIRLSGSIDNLVRALSYLRGVDGPTTFGLSQTGSAPNINGVHTTEQRCSQTVFGEAIETRAVDAARFAPRWGLPPLSELPARFDDANAVYGIDFIRAAIPAPTGNPDVERLLQAMLSDSGETVAREDWGALVEHVRASRSPWVSIGSGALALVMEALLCLFEKEGVRSPGDLVLEDGKYVAELPSDFEDEYLEFSSQGWVIERFREDDERGGHAVQWGFVPGMLKSMHPNVLGADFKKTAVVYARALRAKARVPCCEAII